MPTAIRVNWLEFPETREYARGEMIRWSAEVFGHGEHFGDVWTDHSAELRSTDGAVTQFGGGGGFLPPSALETPAAFTGSHRLLHEPGVYELRIKVGGDVPEPIVRTVRLRIRWQHVRAVAFDCGHTFLGERVDFMQSTLHHEADHVPGAREVLTTLKIPIAIWANTPGARAEDIKSWLARTDLANHVRWVITSQEARVRKPHRHFFDHALREMDMERGEMLFVGNQFEYRHARRTWARDPHGLPARPR